MQAKSSMSLEGSESNDHLKESFAGTNCVALEEQERLKEAEEELRRIEKKKIMCLRILTVLVLFSCALVIIILTVMLERRVKSKKMRIMFEDSAGHLALGFERQINNTVYATWSLSAIITNRFTGMNIWPNVTLPDFQLQCVELLNIARAKSISFSPLVNNTSNRLAWEQYAAENADLIGAPSVVTRSDNSSWIVADGIFRFENGSKIYDPGYNPISLYPHIMNPVWQVYPVENNDRLIMMNGNTEFSPERTKTLDDMIYYKIPALTPPLNLAQDLKISPSTILMFPIFDADNVVDDELENIHNSSATVEGISAVAYSWDMIFSNILPDDVKGLICVLKSSSGEEFTFEVDGTVATFIGKGDLHDPEYNEFEIVRQTSIAKVNDKLAIADNLVYYSLYIYPSDTFLHMFDTNAVMAVTITTLVVFFFITGVFFLYDHLLYLNIERLSYEAHSGNKIVNSLFPEGVRDRYLSMNIKKQESKHKTNKKLTMNSLSAFLSRGSAQSTTGQNTVLIDSEPIADQFPSVTIMFADIPGFRSWSSRHSPKEMFRLLESAFQEFDLAAKKLDVFKVETIEDCYVAVCGLPEPRDDHALVMAQFALECQRKFKQVVKSLADIEADGLQLRSGLHSGPITAGILRGDKSRFQLFGDTMNTASRMESTSIPSKIQISEQTAELLSKWGKSVWFIPREEKITAKGKGMLQTYWLIPNMHMKQGTAKRRISMAARRISAFTRQLQSTRISGSMKSNYSPHMKEIADAVAAVSSDNFSSKDEIDLEKN